MTRSGLFIVAIVALTVSSTLTAPASAAIPSSLPETGRLDAELARLSSETQSAARQLQQLRREVQAARNDVKRAGDVLKSVRQMDQRLSRLIQQLKPYSSIPKVRTLVRALSKNLAYLQKTIHNVRVRTDQAEREVVRPLSDRLTRFEQDLKKPIAKLAELNATTQQARAYLAQAAAAAGRMNAAGRALESAARQVYPSVSSMRRALAQVNSHTNSMNAQLRSVRGNLTSFWTVRDSLAKMDRQMQPGENVARDLDRVLSKRLEIKLPFPPFKRVGFTVKQVLEQPGKILDVVLKPIEKLADKALEPVFKKLKLRIEPPKGLEELTRAVNQLASSANNLNRTLAQCESQLQGEWQRQADSYARLVHQQLLSRTRSR